MVDVSSGRKVKRQFLPALNGVSSLIPPAGKKQAEMRSYTPTYRENVSNLVAEGLKALGQDNYYAQNLAKRATGLAEWSPFGALTAADDAERAYNAGNYGGAGLTALGAIPMVGKGERVAVKVAEDVIPIIRAYHGSPHSFAAEPGAPLGRFLDEKIGTGEGAQAYGRGHYLAENEGVARSYRDTLAGKKKWEELGFSVDELLPMMGANTPELQNAMRPYVTRDLDRMIDFLDEEGGGIEAAREIVAKKGYASGAGTVTYPPEFQEAIAQKLAAAHAAKKGHMYEVNIKADPAHFLDWDKPIEQQSEHVRSALEKGGLVPRPTDLGSFGGAPVTSAPRWADTPEQVEALKRVGIPGIKYVDQGSRGGLDPTDIANLKQRVVDIERQIDAKNVSPEDVPFLQSRMAEYRKKIADAEAHPMTRNYVVFDPRIIEIVKKYGIVGALGLGLISQQDAKALAAQGVGGTEPASQPRSPNILGLK